jgi:hypothetical protein
MIDILFEQRVIQNTGLAAEVIWYASNETFNAKGRAEGVPLPLVFLVLPISFHQRTANALAFKTQPGALYKLLAEDREITVGLQARMQALADRTLQALSIGFQTNLFHLDSDPMRQVIPGRKTPPVTHVTEEVKIILNAAKRVGQAFAEMSVVQLAIHLRVRF